MSVGEALLLLATGLLAAAATMTVAALFARSQGRVAVVDVAWGAGFVVVAVTTALVAAGGVGAPAAGDRRWLVVGLVALWGLRLAWHIRRRAVGHGEDPRYVEVLGGSLEQVGMGVAVRKVFGLQAAVLWFIALPVQLGAGHEVRWWPVVWVGAALWLVGLVFEAVGDAQLTAYKAVPKEQRAPVLDTGLWRYTRHPNYFGDACVWWGLWLAAGLASGWTLGLVTVLCPVAMSFFLVKATGARLLERTMMQRPGYPEYAARTSMFFPLPPKRG